MLFPLVFLGETVIFLCGWFLLDLLGSVSLVPRVMGPITFQSSGVTPASRVCVAYGNLECCNTG